MSSKRDVKPRVGVFGIGLAAYWPQFPRLKERLAGYQHRIESRIGAMGAEVVSAGLVDTAPAAREAGLMLARADLDLLICHVGTYATSSQVLPIVQKANIPVVVLNLQPVAALDYEHTDTGEWLANCSTCCVPEIANAFTRARIRFHLVSGTLDGDDAWCEIGQWCRAAGVSRAIRSARIGFLGHTYPGMLDMYADFAAVHGQLGAHVEVLEMDDLAKLVAAVGEQEIRAKLAEASEVFQIAENVAAQDLDWAARVAVGLDRLTAEFDLDGLTYYYRGLDDNPFERLGAGLILGNSLLTARGIPAAGEGDLKTCVAMMMMDRFGAGGSYTEFYAMDFHEGFVLMGHDGPGHIAISDRKPVLRRLGLYHGKRGAGVSVEFNVRTGPILKIGNTNSRLRFRIPPAQFVNRWCEQGPTHHLALGVGHRLPELRKLSELMLIDLAEVATGT